MNLCVGYGANIGKFCDLLLVTYYHIILLDLRVYPESGKYSWQTIIFSVIIYALITN